MSELDRFSAALSDRPPEHVPIGRTALLVVDMVNDFLDPTGVMPVADPAPVISATRSLVEGGREAGALPIWIGPGHEEPDDGLFRKRAVHGIRKTWGAQLHAELPVREGERVVRKRRYSAFFGTDLDLYLREHDIRRVVVAGVALNICVRSTVHDAFFHGYDVWVVRDACQATGPREEESTLYDIATHFGTVVTVEEALGTWKREPAGRETAEAPRGAA
jgi:ureidoacrylate peracid hydrolase